MAVKSLRHEPPRRGLPVRPGRQAGGGRAAAMRGVQNWEGAVDEGGLWLRLDDLCGRPIDRVDRGRGFGAHRAGREGVQGEGAGGGAGESVPGTVGAGEREAVCARRQEANLLESEEMRTIAPARFSVLRDLTDQKGAAFVSFNRLTHTVDLS